MRKIRVLALAGVAMCALGAEAHAAGFYLQEQGVRGTGRAYSGEVADQGVESLWWNPAAIARSGRELYTGVNGIFVSGVVTDTGSTLSRPLGQAPTAVGGDPRAFSPISPSAVPNIAFATPITDRFAVGVSVAAPFDFITQYTPNAWTRYDALTSTLRTFDLQLTGAMKVNDWLDVGVGFDSVYTQARLSNAVPNFFPGSPDGTQSLRGNGWDFGWNVGLQGHFDRLTVGASYRSKIDHSFKGSVTFDNLLSPFPATLNGELTGNASFTTPWIATVGARYALTDKLTLNGQVNHFGWSQFRTINVETPLGPEIFQQNYHDTTSGGVGVDYALNRKLTLRSGVQYDPTPTADLFRTARVPDGNRWLFGVGATASPTERLKLDAAFLYIRFQDANIHNTADFFTGTLAQSSSQLLGTVQASGYVFSLGSTFKF